MSKISDIGNKFGFKFSFKRLKKSILLVVLFTLIGIGVHYLLEFGSSESGLKIVYEKEIASKFNLEDNTIIKVYKKDINEDRNLDYVFIMGKEKRSSEDSLNSILEMYNDVSFVIIDGKSNNAMTYKTGKSFKSEVTLKISEDEENRYFLISDYNGTVNLLKLKENEVEDIIKNTTNKEFLGYTIYTSKDEENSNILNVKIDNYGKKYLKEFNAQKSLDFTEASVDLSKYRETYLRDKISKFEFRDIDSDGILEFVTTQYILYSLDDTVTVNKTIGKVETYFKIQGNKLVYNKVEIEI